MADTKGVVGAALICNAVGMRAMGWIRKTVCVGLGVLAFACAKTSSEPTASAIAPPPESAAARTAAAPSAPADMAPRAPAQTLSVSEPPLGRLDVPTGAGTAKSAFGMVTSVEPAASRAGAAILEAGGNAVDAAVAVGFALAVTHPSAGNLGGGGFMLVKMVGQPTVALDFREQAPGAVSQPAFKRMIEQQARGTTASAIPGSVAGLLYALEHWGSQPRDAVLKPSIALAAQGHALGERQALVLGWAWPHLSKDPEARRVFGKAGRPLSAGAQLRQPELANTLRAIAAHGDAGFYAGEFAAALIRLTAETAIPISAEDLSQYRARARPPLSTRYRGLLVEAAGPPSAGSVAIVQMLAMLEYKKAWNLPSGSPESLHLLAEVAKRAHAERRFSVADPATTSPRAADALAGVANQEQLARWHSALTWLAPHPIDSQASTPADQLHPLYAAAVRELDNTTHFSVVDRHGNSVSCTTTLSAGFGAKYIVPGTGVVMNNSLAAFGTVGENVLGPGRRMTSSMAPTLVSDRSGPVLVLGSPGGDTIPNTIVQVLRNVVDYKMPLDRAVEQPRIHHGFVPDAIRTERLRPISAAVRRELRRRGHAFAPASRTIGDANNIARTTAGWEGFADPREGGLAVGPAH